MAQPLGVYRNRTVEFKRRRTTTPKSGVHRSRSFSVGGALSPYYFQYHAPLSKSNIPSKKGSKGPILSPCCSTCQHFYCAFGWQEDDGSAALLPRDEKDVENGRAHAGGRLPPEWVDDMDSCKEIMAMIVGKSAYQHIDMGPDIIPNHIFFQYSSPCPVPRCIAVPESVLNRLDAAFAHVHSPSHLLIVPKLLSQDLVENAS